MKEIKKTGTIPLHFRVKHNNHILKRIGKLKSKHMMVMSLQEAVTNQHFSSENFNSPFISPMKQTFNCCLTSTNDQEKKIKNSSIRWSSSMLK